MIHRFIYNKITYKILHPRNKDLGYWEVFIPPRRKEYQDAWKITEEILIDFKKEVEADKGKLLVVAIPEYLMTSESWKDQIKKYTGLTKVPKGSDPFYPVSRLKKIVQRQGILFFDLTPYFLKYRDRFNLKYPYFSFWCDGHWNPVGHFLASNLIAKYLIGQVQIPLSEEDKERLSEKIDKNLALSPLDILGEQAYRQIYSHGVYRGSSNISRILEEK